MKIDRFIEKLGRSRTVLLVTVGSTALSFLLALAAYAVLGVPPAPFSLMLSVLTPLVVAPAISWFLVGLLFKIHQLEKVAKQLATYDSLTDTLNRQAFLQQAESIFLLARRHQTSLALAYLDIDFFKRINDGHGHAAGDLVLQSFARVLRRTVRSSDLVARLGGEEFVLLLPQTDLTGACHLVEQLMAAFRSDAVPGASGTVLHYTVSLGLAALDPETTPDLDAFIQQADAALYQAKRQGRDRCCVHPAPLRPSADD
ncbi:MAG: GGDEF domain-containing protein [Curvibacter sp.]|nr:GGDEF domain-containing protein [Curvibacter sp.]